MSFYDECRRRNWLAKNIATHFLMDGGKLNVPETQASAFLNVYFTHAIIKQERLSVVELKTPIFRLFFDIDASFPAGKEKESTETLVRISSRIKSYVASFFVDGTDTTAIGCLAPPKPDKNDPSLQKVGVHLIFPCCIVTSATARCCRDGLIPFLEEAFRATTSSCVMPSNPWRDVVDDSVFKANGLRMVWSCKGRTEARPYEPTFKIHVDGHVSDYVFETVVDKREAIRETSIRVFDMPVTTCRMGEHTLSTKATDREEITTGTSTSIDMYGSVLPDIRSLLPNVYKDVVFTAAFVTSHAVMLKTTSTYCQNKGGDHRTSTVYFCVSRSGMVSQRCYSRKEENGCDTYASEQIKLPERIVKVFFPGFLPDEATTTHTRKPVKRRLTNLDSMLKRTRLMKN